MAPAVLRYSYPHWDHVLLLEEDSLYCRQKIWVEKLEHWSLWRWEGLSLVSESAILGMHRNQLGGYSFWNLNVLTRAEARGSGKKWPTVKSRSILLVVSIAGLAQV